MFTRQVKVQIGKSTLKITTLKSKCRLWREMNIFSLRFFLHRTSLFHLSTENGRTFSVRDGYPSAFSRADMLLTVLTIVYSIDRKYYEFS